MDKQVFENLLKKLVKDTLGEFKKYKLEYKVKGEIKKIDFVLHGNKVNKNKSITNHIQKNQRIIVNDTVRYADWSAFGEEDPEKKIMLSDYFNDIVEKMEIFNEILKIIKKYIPKNTKFGDAKLSFKHHEPERLILTGFLANLLLKEIKDSITEELVDDYIQTLINEIIEGQRDYYLFDFVRGIDFNSNTIEFDNHIILKKAKSSDFTDLEKFANFPKTYEILKPKIMTKIVKKTVNLNELRKDTQNLLLALRLFRLSSIHQFKRYTYGKTSCGQAILNDEIINLSFTIFSDIIIEKKDNKNIIQYYKKINNSLQEILTDDKYRSIITAISRFDLALFGNVDFDQKLMFVVMGLETLFSTETERTSPSLRLSLRIPKFLEHLDYNIETAIKNIKIAYNFRNKVVHGLNYESNWRENVLRLFPITLNMLRVAIVFRLLTLDLTKQDFVKMLDNSLLIKSKDKKLEELIHKIKNENKIVFKPIIPTYKKHTPLQITLSIEKNED